MIQTEATPNPDSLKFLSENVISAAGTEEFHESKKNEITNPFIKELLNFGGVELVLLSKNFLSVKKTKEASWEELKPMVISHLNDYFEKNKQPILKDKSIEDNVNNNDETVNKILEVLDTKIKNKMKYFLSFSLTKNEIPTTANKIKNAVLILHCSVSG